MEKTTRDLFFEAVDSLYAKIRETQLGNIAAAGQLMADGIAAGGKVYVFDTGHLINSELLNRAGGPVFIKRYADTDVLKANDVLIIGSVSGKTPNVISLGLKAQEVGVNLITLSSHTYSLALEPMHESGKRLLELGKVNIDNCSPYGDGMLDVEPFEGKIIPASGLAAAYIMWAVIAEAVDALKAKGIIPSMLKSANYIPNREFNDKMIKRYEEIGY